MKKSLLIIASLFVLSANAFAEIKTVTLDIPKMDCPMCPFTISAALNNVDGVMEVDAVLETTSATVTYDDTRADIEDLTRATENAGYPSTVKDET